MILNRDMCVFRRNLLVLLVGILFFEIHRCITGRLVYVVGHDICAGMLFMGYLERERKRADSSERVESGGDFLSIHSMRNLMNCNFNLLLFSHFYSKNRYQSAREPHIDCRSTILQILFNLFRTFLSESSSIDIYTMMQNTRASKTGVSLFQPTKTTTHLNKKPILHCRSNANRLSFVTTSAATVDAPSTTNETTPQGKFTPAEWDSFTGAYTSQYIEHAQFLEEGSIEGTIPAELQGTLLRNGPALYEIGGAEIPQPFDGDGMAVTFCFPGGGRPPFVANRFIRTADFLAEQEAGKMIFKGAFSVGNPSGAGFYNPFDFSIKKVANTGIVNWAGRIMALYERDLQYQLTAPDLRTTGRTDAGGAIDGDFIAAHYRIVQQEDGSRRFVGFSSAESGLDNAVTVWELDEAGNQLHRTTATLPDAAFAFLHDFAVTEKYYVFAENPVRLDFGKLLTKYMFGKACIAECLKYDVAAKKTKLHVIP